MRQSGWSEAVRRACAATCAAIIFALGLFAASPVLHEQLHHAASPHDMGCVVALFANGVSVAPDVFTLPPIAGEWHDYIPAASAEILLDAPRYLLPPERGPPVG